MAESCPENFSIKEGFMRHTCSNFSLIPSINHGFFTRKGGVSVGIYDSLNCGYGSGDSLKNVRENRERVAEMLGVDGGELCTASQIHSTKAVIVQETWQVSHAPVADALVTNQAGIAIGVLTADCLPILFVDAKNGVIAAAHAGWKGAFAGIIESTLKAMQQLGAENEHILATIGPAIAEQSYEVGAEFYQNFVAQNAENEGFFAPYLSANSYLFNLPAYGKHRLEKSGITQINIIAKDTFSNDNEFFSYRRSCKRGEPAYGRQISAIMMN
jgi:YfiH family protein